MYNPGLVQHMSGVEMTSFSPARHHVSTDPFGHHNQSPMRDAWTHAGQSGLHLDSGLKSALFQTSQSMGHCSDSMYANSASSVHHPSLEPSVFGEFNNVASMYQPAQVVVPSHVNSQEDYSMEQYADYDANDHVEDYSRSFDSSATGYNEWETVGPQSPDAAYYVQSEDDEYIMVKDELERSPGSQKYRTNSPHRINKGGARRNKKSFPVPHILAERDCHGIIVRIEGKEWAKDAGGNLVARYPDESKPQRCTWVDDDGVKCMAKFNRSEHLKRHMTKHSNEKPYPCPLEGCEKAIKRPDNAGDHFRTHLKGVAKGKRNKPCTLEQLADAMRKDPQWDDKKTAKMLTNLGKWLPDWIMTQEEVKRTKALEDEAKARGERHQHARHMHYHL